MAWGYTVTTEVEYFVSHLEYSKTMIVKKTQAPTSETGTSLKKFPANLSQ